jgi:sec-independent protein translocase protein TatA
MGSFSIWHWLVVLAIVLLLFGTGRVSNLMGEVAKGVKAFRKGLEDEPPAQPKPLDAEKAEAAKTVEKDPAPHS